MNLQEFYYKTNIYEYLLRKEVRAAALIYPVDLEMVQELTYESFVIAEDIKWKLDPVDSSKLWLYKHDYVALLIQEMYKMPHEAKEVMIGLLLGYTPNEEDNWLEYVRNHKEQFNQYEFQQNQYDMYFPENHPELVEYEDDESDYEDPEFENYLDEVLKDDFECTKQLIDCEI